MKENNRSTTNRLALGTASFGLDYGINNQRGQVKKEVVFNILDRAREAGVELLDTAAAYGQSETVIGEYLEAKGHFNIVTKIAPGVNDLAKALTESLLRLGADSIYGCLLHNFDDLRNDISCWSDFEQLKLQNKVKKIGLSVYYPEQLEWAFEKGIELDLVQLPYNILDHRFEKMLPELTSRGVEIHARSVFLQGVFFLPLEKLAGFFAPIRSFVSELHQFAKSQSVSIATVLLQFVLKQKELAKIVVGVNDVNELGANIVALDHVDLDFTKLPISPDVSNEILIPSNWPRS